MLKAGSLGSEQTGDFIRGQVDLNWEKYVSILGKQTLLPPELRAKLRQPDRDCEKLARMKPSSVERKQVLSILNLI